LPDEQLEQDEAQEERSEYLEPNELLLSAYRERQAAIAARVQALKIEEANARAQEAIAEAARDVAKVRRSAERQVALQLEMQRIAQEIEEMDVAYIVALMD
jgi:SHS2 domain-containing protein